MSESSTRKNVEGWYLETRLPGRGGTSRITIERLPFRVGRRRGLDLTLASRSVSGDHAEIFCDQPTGDLRVRDLGSTNGTFVNSGRITESPLAEGDILHIADVEFRVGRDRQTSLSQEGLGRRKTLPFDSQRQLPRNFAPGASKIPELLRGEAFVPVFQPIVRLRDRSVSGYEALTRGRYPGLPEGPNELFRIAADLGLEPELSRAFRRKALKAIAGHNNIPNLFLNTHPEELARDLVRSAVDLRQMAPEQDLVLEIHERLLVDPDSIRRLQAKLAEQRIRLAFDDFGAGEARLVQLAEVPPDCLKFDISFIQNIDQSPASKRHMLSSIVAAASDLGVETIAEGIETEAEAEVCQAIGFTHAQGYFFGRPVTADDL